jgi:hypothetical protein
MGPGAVPLTTGLSYDAISPILSSCCTLGGTRKLLDMIRACKSAKEFHVCYPQLCGFETMKLVIPVSSVDAKHDLQHRQGPFVYHIDFMIIRRHDKYTDTAPCMRSHH